MYCELCLKYNQNLLGCNSCNVNFVNGSTNFRKSALIDQNGSDMQTLLDLVVKKAPSS